MKGPQGARPARKREGRAKHYRFLFPSKVPVPELRVDAEVWDRIVDGLPNGYMLPDDLFLKWMETRVKEQLKAAKTDGKTESGGGNG